MYWRFRRRQWVVWGRLNDTLSRADQLAADRTATPRGQLVIDVEGCIPACYAHAAIGRDGTAATLGLLPQRAAWGVRLITVLTDNGNRGGFVAHSQALGLHHELAKWLPSGRGFVSVAKR